jgi:hypothetical protein
MIRTLAMIATTALLLSLLACSRKPPAPVHVAAPAGQWISLFNGRDLDDWTVKIAGHDVNDNYRNTFRVENGLLKVSYLQYDTFGGRFGSLFHKSKFSHYWFRAEYRFVGDQARGAPSWAYKNSGIQLHSQSPESMRKEQEFPVSVEFDIVGGRLLGRHPTGDVCQNGTRVKIDGAPLTGKCSKLSDITIPGDEWVTIEAEIRGSTRVRQIVNGVLVVEYTDLTLDERDADARRLIAPNGDKALTSGYISIQANSHPIEFRRIEVLPIAQDPAQEPEPAK